MTYAILGKYQAFNFPHLKPQLDLEKSGKSILNAAIVLLDFFSSSFFEYIPELSSCYSETGGSTNK